MIRRQLWNLPGHLLVMFLLGVSVVVSGTSVNTTAATPAGETGLERPAESLLSQAPTSEASRGSLSTRGGEEIVPTDITPPPQPEQHAELIPLAPPKFLWPTNGSISQYFHAGHYAIDIAAHCGEPAIAVDAGSVIYAGWKNNGGGYVVDIRLQRGVTVSYNHLSGVFVSPGQWVNAGQVVGAVGRTGIATGCHLHFSTIEGGVFTNPLAYF